MKTSSTRPQQSDATRLVRSTLRRAVSSGGEHFLDTEGVASSNLARPTGRSPGQASVRGCLTRDSVVWDVWTVVACAKYRAADSQRPERRAGTADRMVDAERAAHRARRAIGRKRVSAVVADARAFLRDLPPLHDRPPLPPHSGGLNPRLGQVFIDQLAPLNAPRIIETGAGNSTLLFLMLGCTVVSIAPDDELERQIRSQAEARGLDLGRLTYVCDRSERALPHLALSVKTRCEAAYIDGNHGWPSVMVDFCYLNMMLEEAGLLFVDDVQIYAVAQLVLLLRSQPGWEFVSLVGKMATFRKKSRGEFLPDFRGEPFILANSLGIHR